MIKRHNHQPMGDFLALRTRPARGQVLPLMASIIALMVIGTLFFFNVTAFESLARNATENSMRSAALAVIGEVDETVAYERWRIDPVAGMALGRGLVDENLVGNNLISNATYQNLFTEALGPILSQSGGTAGGTTAGLDIEVINPAERVGQESQSYLNDPNVNGPVVLCTPGTYPAQVTSQITGDCFDRPTVIMRARLPVHQITGGSTFIVETVVITMGTDV